MIDYIQVRFLKSYETLLAGQTISMPRERAERLIEDGIAVLVEPAVKAFDGPPMHKMVERAECVKEKRHYYTG